MEYTSIIRRHVLFISVFETVFLIAFLSFVFKLYRARSAILKLRRQGLVCPAIMIKSNGAANTISADATV